MTPPPSAAPVLGLKMVRADLKSLASGYTRLDYSPSRRWKKAPGNGVYLAVCGGLDAGGVGEVLCVVEGRKPTGEHGQPCGVVCYAEYRVLRCVAAGPLYAKYRSERDALNAKYQPEWDALYAKYRSERDALYAKHQPEWDALNAKYQTEWDALYAKYQTEWETLYARLISLTMKAPRVTARQGVSQ